MLSFLWHLCCSVSFFIVSVVLSFMCFYCAVLTAVSLWRINLSLSLLYSWCNNDFEITRA